MKTQNIRILRTGITIGSTVYRKDDIVEPLSQTHDLQQLAGGKLHVGHVWAEWVDEATEPEHAEVSEPVTPAQAPEVVATHVEPANPEPVTEAEGDVVDLAEAIKAGVVEGKTKTAIIKDLAKSPTISEAAARKEFDRILALGVVIQGAEAGQYSVA